MLRSRFSTLQAARPSFADGLLLGIANGVHSFADGYIEYLFGELDRVAGAFGHEASMP